MLAHSVLGDAKWFVDLAGTAIAGAVVYVPVLLAFGLAAAEKIAVRNAAMKLRA